MTAWLRWHWHATILRHMALTIQGRRGVGGRACIQCDRWFVLTFDALLCLQDVLAQHPAMADVLQTLATSARAKRHDL